MHFPFSSEKSIEIISVAVGYELLSIALGYRFKFPFYLKPIDQKLNCKLFISRFLWKVIL